ERRRPRRPDPADDAGSRAAEARAGRQPAQALRLHGLAVVVERALLERDALDQRVDVLPGRKAELGERLARDPRTHVAAVDLEEQLDVHGLGRNDLEDPRG